MITNNNFADGYRRLNNKDQVAYCGHDGNDYEIYLWRSGAPAQRITNNDTDDINLRLNDAGEIVWQGYDLSGLDDWSSGDWEIYYYNGKTIKQLTKNDYDDIKPHLTQGGNIVWAGSSWGETFKINLAGKENYYEYSYTFSYSNGDKYYGTVRTTANQYYLGQKINAPAAIEGGLTGSYLITGMSYYSVPGLAGQVTTNGYWNSEDRLLYTPIRAHQAITALGLGKETDFIISAGMVQYRFGFYNNLFYEADN